MRFDWKQPTWTALVLAGAACRSGGDELVDGTARVSPAAASSTNEDRNAPETRVQVATSHDAALATPLTPVAPLAPMADGFVRAELGQLAPDFALKDLDGREWKL